MALRSSWTGRTVLVLGSSEQPDGEVKDEVFPVLTRDETDIRVEEAALAIARGVLARGGRLVFRDDPVFTPLFIEVAREYWDPAPAEGPRGETARFATSPLMILAGKAYEQVAKAFQWAAAAGLADISGDFRFDGQPDLMILIGDVGGNVLDDVSQAAGRARPRIVWLPSTAGTTRRLPRVEGIEIEDIESAIEKTRFMETRFELSSEFAPEVRHEFREPQEQERVPLFRYAIYPAAIAVLLDEER